MSLLSAVPIMILAFVHVPWAVYPLVAIEGATVIVADVVFMTMMQRTVPSEVLGRVFGIMDSLMVAGILVGTVLAPVLVQTIGLRGAMVAAGGSIVAVTLLALPRARAVDEQASRRVEELAGLVDLLERAGMFDDASRPALEGLAAAAVRVEIPTGTVVINEGDAAEDLFVVGSGTLEVTAHGERSEEQHLGTLGPADHFGEIGVLERLPRTATVRATTDCVVYRISATDFLQAVSETPRMSGRLSSTMATRLARTHPGLRAAAE